MPSRSKISSARGSKASSNGKKTPAKKSRAANLQYVLPRLEEEYGPWPGLVLHDSLDFVLLSLLLLHLPLTEGWRAYRAFKSQFVDWNEVRIATAKEVQDVLRQAEEPLELSLFLKGFLHRLFTERHHVGLEFLHEMNISEIRSFFKKSPGFSESTVNLILERLKEYPVLPLEVWMQRCVERLGLVTPSSTSLQRQKDLYSQMPREKIFEVHSYLKEHARSLCGPHDKEIDCPHCVLKRGCPYPKKRTAKKSTKRK